MLFTPYSYPDVYNWCSRIPGYSLMMVVMLYCLGCISKYANTGDKKTYMTMIISGVISCTGLMYCVTVGLFYIFLIFIINERKHNILEKIKPFLYFVLSGIVTVAAPGNFRRTISYEKSSIDLIGGVYVTAYDLTKRYIESFRKYPWMLGLLVSILIVAFVEKVNERKKLKHIVIGYLFTFIASFGALYPYIVGERKQIGDELATRANYISDYIMIIGLSFLVFETGQWIAFKLNIRLKKTIVIAMVPLIMCISFACAKMFGTLMYVVPYDIMVQRDRIKEINNVWDSIILEIESSKDTDVVIHKTDVPWSRFSYPMGLDSGDESRIVVDERYYGNVNQCAQIWYKKKKIKVYINQ
jgi:hypothetical protein